MPLNDHHPTYRTENEEDTGRELNNGDQIIADHEEAQITEIRQNGQNTIAEISYTGELHTVIPVRYRSTDNDERSIQTHHIITLDEPDNGAPIRQTSIVVSNIFLSEQFSRTSRSEAIRRLGIRYDIEDIEPDLRQAVRQLELVEQLEPETSAEEDIPASEHEDTAETEEDSRMLITDRETHEQLQRDMDGRYNYTQNREEELREMALDIETRVDHLLRKRQRIKEKLEEITNNE